MEPILGGYFLAVLLFAGGDILQSKARDTGNPKKSDSLEVAAKVFYILCPIIAVVTFIISWVVLNSAWKIVGPPVAFGLAIVAGRLLAGCVDTEDQLPLSTPKSSIPNKGGK